MNLKTINVIIRREYLTRVKKKSFLFVTFLGPIFFAAIAILPSLIMIMAKDDGNKVAVVDNSGIIMPKLTDTDMIAFQDFTGQNVDTLKTTFSDLDYDALVVVSDLDQATKSVSVSAYTDSPMSVDLKDAISRQVDDAIEDYRLAQYDIDDLKTIMDEVKSNISISTYTLADGEEKISSSEVYMFISLFLSIIIYMFIAMFSGMVMQSVIEEKTSRVVEVLVSSVKATELMFGKIIGVACVALTQFFLWIVLTGAIITGVSAFVDFDSMAGVGTQTEQMAQMASGFGVDEEALQSSGMAIPDVESIAEDSEFGAVLTTLRDINYVQLIISFIIYFVLGYLLYASLFAAIGSAVENEADTQQLSIPITIPLLLAFFIAFYAFKAPDSQVVFWGSIIPFTSPIVMLARIPFGVPAWELLLSIGLLLVTFVFTAWASAKIYRIGILMFGKKSTFKDLYKWLKQK